MKKKRILKLQDIQGYIAHKPIVICRKERYYIKTVNPMLETVELIPVETDKGLLSCHEVIKNIKPLLRPLSDIYREITHEDKIEIPIVELAKIEFPEEKWEFHSKESKFYSVLKSPCAMSDAFLCVRYCTKRHCIIVSSPDSYGNPVTKQYQILDYMHSRFIDYRNLINTGMAFDINSYKQL
ncbi:MAG: hypothetical protein LBE56_12310 [Tannerella sp.]|jgi:hypothetical protein|nr:hypothetical protein [Tannerella sp.]